MLTRIVLAIFVWLLFVPLFADVQTDQNLFEFVSFDPISQRAAQKQLKQTRRQLIDLLDDSLSYIPTIYMATSQAEFDSLIGGYFPDWGAGAAIPIRGKIIVKSPNHFKLERQLGELLAHEYAHLALAHRTDLRELPRWFNEGMAMYISMEWGWSNNLSMSKAAVFRQFVPLVEIDQVNRFGSSKAQIAYAESYLAVKYLFDEYGKFAVTIFLNRLAAGDSADEALIEATGSNTDDFQKEVWVTFESRFNLLSLFMDTIYFWLVLALILIIGGALNFKKRRRYYKQFDEDEKLHSTDFDYGDPDNPEQIDDEDEAWRG